MDDAVSPVVAVILLVAITVALSAVVGAFALNLGQSTTDSGATSVGVTVQSDSTGHVTVQLVDVGNADVVVVRNSSGAEKTLTQVGETVTIQSNGDPVTVISQKDGESTVVQSYAPSSDSATVSNRGGWIDTWEDGDNSEYGSVYNGHDVSISTTSYERSHSVRIDPTFDDATSILSTSNLSHYPQQGDTFEVWLYPTYDGDSTYEYHQPAVFFGTGGTLNSSDGKPGNGYLLLARMGPSDDLIIGKRVDGTNTNLNKTTIQWENHGVANSWIRLQVEWGTDGSINATVYDSAGNFITAVNTTDTTFTDGGFGVSNTYGDDGENHAVYWDAANITNSS